MVIDDVGEAAAELSLALASAGHAVAFTGAGLSTESGVPDYRSPGSPWTRHAPIPFADFLAAPERRVEAWRRKFAMDDLYAGARPSRGHHALSRLVAAGGLRTILTQNIDGLQQASGTPPDRLVELHGNGTYATCLTCARRHELASIREALEREAAPPACEACGGIVKSATISFGQALSPAALGAAQTAALAADLFLASGSSLVVRPAAALPLVARRNGARLVILNGTSTALDDSADLLLRGDIGTVLSRVLLPPRPRRALVRSLDHT